MSNHKPAIPLALVTLITIATAFAIALTGCSELFGGDDTASGPVNRGIGDECDSIQDCRPGLICDHRMCSVVADGVEGDTCTLTDECTEDLYCQAVVLPTGSTSGVCAPAGQGEVGDACGSNAACVRGNYCEYFGFSGTCQASGDGDLGDECGGPEDCMSGLTCAEGLLCVQSPIPAGVTIFDGADCSASEAAVEDPFHVLFDVPRSGESVAEFYALPFPNDIRLTGGHVDLNGHAHPTLDVEGNLLKAYVDAIEQDIEGFGPHEAVFFRFSSFPDADSITAGGEDSVISLVNIDPDSPDYSHRRSLAWTATNARGLFICYNWLGVRPFWSQPFDEDTTYAAIIRDGIRGGGGELPQQSPDFAAVIGDTEPSDPDLAAAWEAYAPLRAYLDDQDVDPSTVMAAAVFTTDGPTSRHAAIREAVEAFGVSDHGDLVLCDDDVTSPCDDGLEGADHVRGCFAANENFYEIHTRVEIPIYQDGDAPYFTTGGSFLYGADGRPILQRSEEVCASITIPKDQAMPEAGWPVAVHGHGTGGNFRSFNNRYVEDLSAAGYATVSYEGTQHGERRGDSDLDPETLFFNYANPRAARGNALQGMVDVMAFGRFASALQVTVANSPTGAEIAFDPDLTVFFGHSQGATVGLPALAVDDVYEATVLSGVGGGLLLSFLEKTKPVNVSAGVQALLQSTSLNDFHPMLNLVQLYFEQVETLNFSSGLVLDRPDSMNPYHVFMTYGVGDSYTPNRTTRELALNSGLSTLLPSFDEMGRPTLNPPISGNISVGEMSYTGVIGQYEPPEGTDGHHVVWNNADARTQVLGFLETFVTEGLPTVPAP